MGFAWSPPGSRFVPVSIALDRNRGGYDFRPEWPASIAFLREYGVKASVLEATTRRACRDGVSAAEALLARGDVSPALYFRCLARHLDLPFVDGWPVLAMPVDPVRALGRRQVRLADGRWLIAPTGDDLAVLLAAASRADLEMPALAITTPAHFDALVLYRAGASVAAQASAALPTARPQLSAKGVAGCKAAWMLAATLLAAFVGLWIEARLAVDVIGAVFFAAMAFRACVCAAGTGASADDLRPLADAQLPRYSVLVALHKEAAMIPSLIANLEALRYPASKLEILILIEVDDHTTRDALAACALPPHIRVVVVPDGKPRTKPRALNVGLMIAQGELVTVYDAEDRPDPDQLRKAAARFARGSGRLACLQGRLAMGNGAAGFLPRMFAIEYAALFDLLNVGSDRLGLPIALGGTSNHFRTSVLRSVGGWDAWNVTEDADLGLRLARFGYAVGDLDSTTGETAPETFGIWFRQRQRWTKGWMQTLLVLARDGSAVRDFGAQRALVVALLLTCLVTGPLITPFATALALVHLYVHGAPSPHGVLENAEATLAVSVFALGIASTIGCGYAGMKARGLDAFRRSLPLLVVYQLLISAAAWGGLFDLVIRPYHWRKTAHKAPPTPGSKPGPDAPQGT